MRIFPALIVALLLGCGVCHAETPSAVAVVCLVEGSVEAAPNPDTGFHLAKLYERFSRGTIFRVGKDSRAVLAFLNGKRFEFGSQSQAVIGQTDLASSKGLVKALPSYPITATLAPILDAENTQPGTVRIRGEGIGSLYPREAIAVPPGRAVFRFDADKSLAPFTLTVKDEMMDIVYHETVESSPVEIDLILKAASTYTWRVESVVQPASWAETDFQTLTEDENSHREMLVNFVHRSQEPDAWALLAAIDSSLGLLWEAREELRKAIELSGNNRAFQEAYSEVDRLITAK